MVNGLNNYLDVAGISDLASRRKSDKSEPNNKSTVKPESAPKTQIVQSSLDFKMDMARSLQIVENEGKRSISYSMSMNFSLSVDEMGRLKAKLDDASAPKSTDEDYFSPESTANRIVDFVKSVFRYVDNSTDSRLKSENGIQHFQQLQTDAVKEGFRQARKLLGQQPQEIEGGIGSTYDLVMKGLDDFFGKLLKGETEPTERPARKDPASANYYSSRSFSLSYQVEIQADGRFSPQELDDFIGSSFQQVKDLFQDFTSGINTSDMSNLFSLDKLDSGRIAGLLSE